MLTFFSILTSVIAILFLSDQDEKRRRVFRLPKRAPRYSATWLWVICLSPGAVLALISTFSSWLIWFGAASCLGWLVVSVPPGQFSKWLEHLDRAGTRLEERFSQKS